MSDDTTTDPIDDPTTVPLPETAAGAPADATGPVAADPADDPVDGPAPDSAADASEPTVEPPVESPVESTVEPPKKAARRRARRPVVATFSEPDDAPTTDTAPPTVDEVAAPAGPAAPSTADPAATDDAPEGDAAPRRRRARRPAAMPTFQAVDPAVVEAAEQADREAAAERADHMDAGTADGPSGGPEDGDDTDGEGGPRRRRRGRRGRGRGRGEGADGPLDGSGDGTGGETGDGSEDGAGEGRHVPTGDRGAPVVESGDAEQTREDGEDDADGENGDGTKRRRRRRRRSGGGGEEGEEPSGDDPPNTVVKVREPRAKKKVNADGIRGVTGSTRLEAKRQRRRDGRGGSGRAPIVTESEYLARREAVERTMVVRNQGERTQIAVLEDGVLVEHYVTRASAAAYAGNVYLGKVQNVLPSMEAAFLDIGKGRNAVLYAGEVNYDAAGIDGGRAHSIQEALKSGQNVLVQVTKDPIGQKGARLTSQITLPGRYLVYVPEGSMTGISRKLPDTERARLKAILKKIVPDDAGVIIRTAAEGASEEELSRDVERLQQQWADIQAAAKKADKHAPAVLHAEPDLVVRVVRDVFNEDFTGLVVQGDSEWETIEAYVSGVAPDLLPRVSRWTSETDAFTSHRVTEQLVRALDRKVHLPSGGSLVIDRTEAMTVVDVNTGKFTGKGGNLEETVTKNNLEAAEEIVRQLRLRDVGGIIVIDFIDMVLESNRELVLRRLTECLGRDRTRHQVAEVTSLGLVQMTRKRVGTGLIEAYSEPCLACQGRGVLIHMDGPPARSGGSANGHTHTPAPVKLAPVRPKAPVPRPPAVRPDPEPDAESDREPDTGEGTDAETGTDTVPDGTPAAVDHVDGAAVLADETLDGVDTAAESLTVETPTDDPAPVEVAPVAEPVAPAPKRRRRRATSGGPVSADPDQVPVS